MPPLSGSRVERKSGLADGCMACVIVLICTLLGLHLRENRLKNPAQALHDIGNRDQGPSGLRGAGGLGHTDAKKAALAVTGRP